MYEPGVMEINVENGLRCVPVDEPKAKLTNSVSKVETLIEWVPQHRTELSWVDIDRTHGRVTLFKSHHANQVSWVLYHLMPLGSSWRSNKLIKRWEFDPEWEDLCEEVRRFMKIFDMDVRHAVQRRDSYPSTNWPKAQYKPRKEVLCPVARK